MRKLILSLFLTCVLGSTAFGEGFYDVNTIHTIKLVFTQSNWDAVLDSLYSAGDGEGRLLGTAYIDDVQYDSVGVRYKGNSTYKANQTKNPFNIKLDYVIADQEVDGYGTLKLTNVWKDPSFVREVVSYDIARKYMPACQANYANIYVNNTLIGLYVNVQDIDKEFCRQNFYEDTGARFKGAYDGMPTSMVIWGYRGTSSSSYTTLYALESDSGWTDLIHFLDTLNNYSTAVEQVLNVDRHLWFLAYSILMVHLDAPINMAHNFYLYEDQTNRFNTILWDMNMNFGGFTSVIGGSNLSVSQMQQLAPTFNSTNSNYPIVNKFLSNSTYYKRYIAHMKTIMAENFANGWYSERAYELQDIVAASVQADPNKFYTYANFLANVASSAGSAQETTVGIVQLMGARVTYLSSLAAFTATAPTVGTIAYAPTTARPNSSLNITAAVSSATSVLLGYRSSITDKFVKVTMLDDGAHGDGSSGDGTYGATITTVESDVQYYVLAENASAATFSPARAEYEYYTVPVSNALAINEFMASNTVTLADPSGEYDDWIELYNNSTSEIDLSGYYLSDEADNPTKWTFPDTTIAAQGYLIIWADEDQEQSGLHCNFKLSGGGETFYLSDPTMNVVDEVTYDVQATDVSTGRCDNGSGSFVTMTPTPGAVNRCGTGEITATLNEFMAANTAAVTDPAGDFEDWIELYNYSSSSLDLTGCYLSNEVGNLTKWTFPAATIPAGGYLVIWCDNETSESGVHCSFDLSAAGEVLYFSNPSQGLVESVTFGAQTDNVSMGRCPDGTGSFVSMVETPGALNNCGTADIPVTLNEFMASNTATVTDLNGEYEDWIELYNTSSADVALTGYHLSDEEGNLGKWTFPEIYITAHGYLVVWADEDEDQSGLHANFKLAGSGESLYLSDPSQNLIESIMFGTQTDDVSVGRCANGTGSWVTLTATPGAANDCGSCCESRVGDVNGSGNDEPTIGDISTLIDALFISSSAAAIPCLGEADINRSGGSDATFADITIGDISVLIDYLFITGSSLGLGSCQ